MELASRLLIRRRVVVTQEGVAAPASRAAPPDATLVWQRGVHCSVPLELALSARDVEEALIRRLVPTPEVDALQSAIREQGASGAARHALCLHAAFELIPAIRAAEGTILPGLRLAIPCAEVSLPKLLAALQHPFGYAVGWDRRIYRLLPTRDSQRHALVKSSVDRTGLEQRLHSVLSAFAEAYRARVSDALRSQLALRSLGVPGAPGPLYRGRGLSVWMEAGDQLTVRRKLRPWWIRRGLRLHRFPAVELRVWARLAGSGVPQFQTPVRICPQIRHPFATGGSICLAGWNSQNPSWAARGLELLNRAEEVLVMPSNLGD